MPWADKSRYYSLPGQSKQVALDLSQWDALYANLTGGAPGRATVDTMLQQADASVKEAAEEVLLIIQADTPVDTGALKASVHTRQYKAADHAVRTELYYAPIVESRPPGGPAKYFGAMFAQNVARATAILAQKVEAALRQVVRGQP